MKEINMQPRPKPKPNMTHFTGSLRKQWLGKMVTFFWVALAYYLTGQFGLLFSIPPSDAGIIWPAAGLALVSVAFLGWPAATGVFVGAFLTTVAILPEEVSILLSVVNGLASAGQACIATWLIKRLTKGEQFFSEKMMIKALIIGGPIASLTSATLCLSMHYAVGQLPVEGFLNSWLFWWLGDSLGVMIFAPLMLPYIGRGRHIWQGEKLMVMGPVLFSFACVVLTYAYAVKQENNRIETDFQRVTNEMAYQLQGELQKHITVSEHAGDLFDTPEQLDTWASSDRDININLYPLANETSAYTQEPPSKYGKLNHLKRTDTFDIGGKSLILVLSPKDEFFVARYSGATWGLLLGGLFFTALLTMFALTLTIRSIRTEQIVIERTKKLSEEVEEKAALEKIAKVSIEHFQRALNVSDIMIWDWGIASGEALAIPSWEEFLGYKVGDVSQVKTAVFESLIHPDDKLRIKLAKETFIRDAPPFFEEEFRMRRKDGSWAWILNKGELAEVNSVGKAMRARGTRIDITERKRIEESSRISAISFDTHEGIMITDAANNIIRVNQAFCEISGYQERDVIGVNPRLFSSGKHDKRFYAALWDSLEDKGRWEGEIWNKTKLGHTYPAGTKITNVLDAKGVVTHRVAVFSDVTQRKIDEKAINQLAFYDPLTTLPNRRLFMTTVEHELSQARRHRQYGGLIFFDLDHFKTINDSLGHVLGDVLLSEVGKRLNALTREADMAARLGGDEFVVLLSAEAKTETEAAHQTLLVAEKIQTVLSKPYRLAGSDCHISTSIGVRLYPLADERADTLIANADTAMYKAKQDGRNRICFYNENMQEAADEWLSLKNDLHIAIDNEEFELYFQCQYNQYNEVVGAEALIRWHHPEKGLVSPAKFIPLAEQTGQIEGIGEWVLRKACEYLNSWELEGLSLPHISINVSSKQFNQAGFVASVQRVLSATGANAEKLMLELTEGVALDRVDETIEKMNQLKELGMTISLDDFGTGYSSLSYLKKLPLDQLKIDQAFVADIATDADDAIIVETIISMAKHMQFDVIAEGVETEEQYDFLLQKGCQAFQGYYFARPESAETFADFLRHC